MLATILVPDGAYQGHIDMSSMAMTSPPETKSRAPKPSIKSSSSTFQKDNFLPQDCHFLLNNMVSHLVMPTMALLNLLTTYKPVFKDSTKKAKKHTLHRVMAIATYFEQQLYGEC
jgi:hypothetical protein